ncbi:PEP-CTERM sorting domain-containing protein [Aquabacterium lacunae]|uniref:PEP-CTERM sorting domain-containing protein n=2 Tax=Aquabacterium lacunae TaxID=2528630 RepID=A0A4Q9GYL1_9BURK|nr:PEP-CTERM sorting domain-containing protein [Aquabacterium lacunae]
MTDSIPWIALDGAAKFTDDVKQDEHMPSRGIHLENRPKREPMSFKPALMPIVALAMATAAPIASATTETFNYTFQTFFDTSTFLNTTDKKTFAVPVASLSIADVSGGVQLTLNHFKTAFPAKTTSGTFIDNLWLDGPNGSIKLKTTNTLLAAGTGYNILFPDFPEPGYGYDWDIDFKAGTFAEGETAVLTILGKGVTARSFTRGTTPMLDISNVGSPYKTLLSSNVHFLGTPAVPEPSTYGMLLLGLAGLAAWSRRKPT